MSSVISPTNRCLEIIMDGHLTKPEQQTNYIFINESQWTAVMTILLPYHLLLLLFDLSHPTAPPLIPGSGKTSCRIVSETVGMKLYLSVVWVWRLPGHILGYTPCYVKTCPKAGGHGKSRIRQLGRKKGVQTKAGAYSVEEFNYRVVVDQHWSPPSSVSSVEYIV